MKLYFKQISEAYITNTWSTHNLSTLASNEKNELEDDVWRTPALTILIISLNSHLKESIHFCPICGFQCLTEAEMT